jgi:hypothetical protein
VSMLGRFFADFRYLFIHHKAWWITPIVVILVVIALLAVFSDDTGVIPFIYTD